MPIDFEPEAPQIDFEPIQIDFTPETVSGDAPRVAQMADATRHTVGVVGRAIAARDLAIAGADAPDRSQLEDGYQPDESSLAPLPGNIEPRAVAAFPALASNVGAVLTKTIPLPRVTSQQVTDAMDYLASTAPGLTQEERDDWLLNTRQPGNLEKIVAGAQRAAISVPESMTSLFGAATLGTGALGVTAGRVVAGAFGVWMASHVPEQITELKAAIASGDSERITEASGNLLVTTTTVAATGKHALTKPKTPLEQVAPVTAEAVAKVNLEPTAELKPGDVLPEPLPPTVGAQIARVEAAKDASGYERTSYYDAYNNLVGIGGRLGSAVNYVEVYPQFQRKGIGSEILSDLVKRGGTAGIAGSPEGRALLKSAGWTETEPHRFEPPPPSATPLTTAALESVKGPVRETPAPTPAAAAGESGSPPVTAGVPPAKPSVTQGVTIAKPEGEQPLTTKWTAATRAGVDLGKQTLAGIPDPVATVKAVIALAKDAAPYVKKAGEALARVARTVKGEVGEYVSEQANVARMTDYRRSVLNWSSKLQTSFGEAELAQREIRSVVPDATRRDGVTNWIQANGDAAVLRARADATADAKLKAGYEAALALTPEELAVANDVRATFEELGQRGQTFDVLNTFKENYVTQTWDLGRGPATGGSRTLKERFRFSKASTFDTYFDGEQAGYVPKTKDIAKLLPMYLHEMNSVIAARQLVQEMAGGKASDGRTLLVPRGGGVPVEGIEGKATLVMPGKIKGETRDYKVLPNQPALTDWRWASKDTDGNPIFLKADLALHPDAYSRLKNVLGKSAIREWYQTRTSAAAQIPKMLVKAIDVGQKETKRTMLGFFAPFHQVQEGTHAVGHRVNPFFGIPKIDLIGDAAQRDATRHGLMLLPDRTSADQFMEGFRHSGLISAIPQIGPAADWYSHYLFQEYIPGLKYKTYQHILERNQKVYAKDLASGEVKLEDIKVLSSEQSNAAYGHLNYADLARNPTIQHVAQLGLLAPDFFEARARFAAQGAKGLTGAKVGREQILALATLAIAQATTAWIAAETTGGHWDTKHPFEMVHGDRRYSMRSVPEDIAGLLADSRKFVYSRLSPLVGKGIVQGLSGVDYKGSKVTIGDTAKELAQAPIPLPLRGFVGTSNRNLSAWEELAGSVGLRISRYYPEEVTHAMQLRDNVDLWVNRSKKLDTDEERAKYLLKQLEELEPGDRKQAVIRLKQRTSKGVRQRIR